MKYRRTRKACDGMSKDLSISVLLDFYKHLLTDKQTDSLDLYYNQDLSLSEISEHLHITRQGVRDNIKRGEKQLLDYENSLQLAGKFSDIMRICNDVSKNITQLENMGLADETLKYIQNISDNIREIEDLM